MELITIRQFARDQHISYEAVRKQVVRYADQLEKHIIRENRTQYLDKFAVEFLKERRRESPIVVVTQDQDGEIESLKAEVETAKAEIEALKTKLMSAQTELLKEKDRVIELQETANKAIEDRTKYNLLLEESATKDQKIITQETIIADLEKRAEDLIKQTEDLQRERDEAQAEAGSFEKSFFGFYRKK